MLDVFRPSHLTHKRTRVTQAAGKAFPRHTLPSSLLAGLLGSTALLTGSGAALAEACVTPYTVAEGDTCSNMVIGSGISGGGQQAPTWATVENRGTIDFNKNLNDNGVAAAAAISMFSRPPADTELDKKTTITNFGIITGGTAGFGIYLDAAGGLESLTNNKGGEITGTTALNSISTIKSINNSGLMKGSDTGIYSQNGGIEDVQNGASGEITGGRAGIHNLSDIGKINNAGVIASTAYKSLAIWNDQYTIGEITNSGTITGEAADGTIGVGNDDQGVITLLNNLRGGRIIGTASGVTNTGTSEITTLTNAGTIQGGESGLVNAGKIGTFNNNEGGAIIGALFGVNHSGSIVTLTNAGAITAENTQNAFALFIDTNAKLETLTNSGTISGTSTGGGIGSGVVNYGAVTTLTNSGSIAGSEYGVYHSGSIGTLTNDGTIKAENATQDAWGVRIDAGSTLTNLFNNNVISGFYTGDVAGAAPLDPHGYGVRNEGMVTTLTNSGSITGSFAGVGNSGSITTLNNKRGGFITGEDYGVYDAGTIGALTNDGTIKAENATRDAWGVRIDEGSTLTNLFNNNLISGVSGGGLKGYGVANAGAVNTLTNSKEISGSFAGVVNPGSITTLNNKRGASITGGEYGVYDSGSIVTLTNDGTIKAENTTRDAWGMRVDEGATLTNLFNNNLISGASTGGAKGYGVANAGAVNTLTNSKEISGSYAGLYNIGSIPTLKNNTGASITGGVYGVYDAGTIGALTNDGTIKAENTTRDAWGLRADVGATLTDFVNNNLISGASAGGAKGYGVANAGAITTLTNNKDITGSYAGLYNAGSIPTFNNTANASITGAVYGLYDSGTIGALSNAGSINATAPSNPTADATGLQIVSGGSLTRLQNDGSITAVNTSKAAYGVAIQAQGSIGELTNTKTISGSATGGGNGYGVANAGAVTTLTNSKTITGSYAGLSNTGSISTLNNNAGASITGGAFGLYDSGSIGALTNAGTINATAPSSPTADATALLLDTGARITTFRNEGDISAVNTTRAAFAITIRTDQIFDSFTNTRTLSATSTSGNATALFLDSAAQIRTLTNAGALNGASSAGGSGYGLSNAGTITDLTNKSVIFGSTFGISNTGVINTFTNYQGGGGSASPAQSALTYAGKLPGSYFIHITSSTYYGQVAFTNPTGSMAFGVTQDSNIEKRTYDSVLSNLDTSAITGDRTGTLKGLTWYLERHPGSTTVWDLVFKDPTPPTDPTTPTDPRTPIDPTPPTTPVTPPAKASPSVTATLATLNANAINLRQALNARTAAMAGAMDDDCATFDAEGYCLSFQARYSAMDSMSEGAGVLIGARRLSPQLRLGAFIDYSLVRRDPQGLKFGDPQPLIGAFLGYDQEGEGRGLQGKLTAAMNRGAVSVSRAGGLADTEPGSGKASLNSFGFAGEIGWGLALDGETLVTPYLGLRHTQARRGAYGESAMAGGVDFPLSYAPFSQSLTTATAGMRLKGQLTDKIGFQLGLGAEYDLAQKASAYAGASTIPGLETFALPGAQTSNRFRPVGNVSLFYQIDRTQRLTGNVSVRGQAFSNQMAVSVMVGYQAAF